MERQPSNYHQYVTYLWYFITIWVGSKDVVKTIKAFLRNYFGMYAQTRVSWYDDTMLEKHDRLSITNLKRRLTTLLRKWIIAAFLLENSIMQQFVEIMTK